MPYFLLRPFLRLLSFLCYTLNLDLRGLGIASDPFGSLMITNIGSLGLDTAYAPLVPFSRVPILFAIGEAKDQVLVENGQVIVGKIDEGERDARSPGHRRLPRRPDRLRPPGLDGESRRPLRRAGGCEATMKLTGSSFGKLVVDGDEYTQNLIIDRGRTNAVLHLTC